MNADGTNQTQLTFDPAFESIPSLSPDGTKIVYRAFKNSQNEIWMMNADGTEQPLRRRGQRREFLSRRRTHRLQTFNGEVAGP